MLNQCLESLVQKIQSGVVINFEKTGPDPPPLEGTRRICLSFISKGPFYHLLRCICLIYRDFLCSYILIVLFILWYFHYHLSETAA